MRTIKNHCLNCCVYVVAVTCIWTAFVGWQCTPSSGRVEIHQQLPLSFVLFLRFTATLCILSAFVVISSPILHCIAFLWSFFSSTFSFSFTVIASFSWTVLGLFVLSLIECISMRHFSFYSHFLGAQAVHISVKGLEGTTSHHSLRWNDLIGSRHYLLLASTFGMLLITAECHYRNQHYRLQLQLPKTLHTACLLLKCLFCMVCALPGQNCLLRVFRKPQAQTAMTCFALTVLDFSNAINNYVIGVVCICGLLLLVCRLDCNSQRRSHHLSVDHCAHQ